ncbi:MAG: hypothetical protein IKC22_06615 [Bacilli bacterium]|nr:hypothetical protein [Bacilli bacterium]
MIYKTITNYLEASKDFLENEKQFHLGVIPTEQSNPKTRNLSATIAKDTQAGVKTILSADEDIAKVALGQFKTPEFEAFVSDIKRCMDERRKVVFSSVGASGRMAIQMDGAWRTFWQGLVNKIPAHRFEFLEMAEVVSSFTTGGDRALVRSVENFEDYMTFGAKQVDEAEMTPGDVLVALSECGLSASINGSAVRGYELGIKTYYLFCNPEEILRNHLDRARAVFECIDEYQANKAKGIDNGKYIVKIPLFVGNMAVSGSTRMQVTTVELLAAGAALEVAANRWLVENLTKEELEVIGGEMISLEEYAAAFESLNKQLSSGEALAGLAKAVEYEVETYNEKGLITYITHDYLLDIMTDTTERQPTFTLPPFKKYAEVTDNLSWAYIKDPLYPSYVAWQHVFRRPIKGLEWTVEDYKEMKASQDIINNPPLVSGLEVLDYNIGYEDDPSRYSRKVSNLVLIDVNGSATPEVVAWYKKELSKYSGGVVIRFGQIPAEKISENEIRIPIELPRTCTDILYHLLVKVAFNCLSTGTMAKMGRVFGNWMVQVLPTNKKLIDRSTRIIASLAQIPYEQANQEFFKSYYNRKPEDEYKESYVVETLKRLGFDPNKDIE